MMGRRRLYQVPVVWAARACGQSNLLWVGLGGGQDPPSHCHISYHISLG